MTLDIKKQWTKYVLISIGLLNILFGLLGLKYNYHYLSVFIGKTQNKPDFPYFYQALYTMSSICIITYILLIITGIRLIQQRIKWINILIGIFIFELIYIPFPGGLWLSHKFGSSIAAASGVSCGGMMYQFIILYPIWALILIIKTRKKITKIQKKRT